MTDATPNQYDAPLPYKICWCGSPHRPEDHPTTKAKSD